MGRIAALLLLSSPASGQVNVLTNRYDGARTGANLSETVLTVANVNPSQFGKLYTYPVDGSVYAQPLYVSGVVVNGTPRNVLYVATMNDKVYAFDADNPNFPPGMAAETLFHPTFLYESLWNLAGVGILLLLDRKFNFRRGRLFCLYAIYYTLGRVWIEAMRIDDAELINLFGITTRLNVWTSIFVLLGALAAFIILGLRKRTEPDTVYLPGREPSEVEPAAGADDEEVNADADDEVNADADAAADADADAENDGKTHADAKPATVPATVPAGSAAVQHSDSGVSDSESRDNLPENQSGPGRASTPVEASKESTGGTKPATGAPATGTPGHQGAGTAPEAEGTK
ncbi:prolipoprotein diacylglyceryl transferase family protein [uncultured Arthrobacter sp.]|uniref:prolipoprotein diacylglyceryl transferase family protein n=1 Tax=uncultured Arthrobacter sp. TaxID=114050 RepID=UPI003217A77D